MLQSTDQRIEHTLEITQQNIVLGVMAEKCAKAWIAFVIWSSASPILSFPVNFFNFGSRSPQGRRGVAMKKRCGSERLLEEGEGTRHPRIESLKLT
jgi:hypothetical protein